MIIINRLNNRELYKERTFVISDFDRTITTSNSSTSWSIFNNSNLVDDGFKIDSKRLYDYYRKIELDQTISILDKKRYMNEWTVEEVKLFSKYNINKKRFYEIIDESNGLVLRKDFVHFCNQLLKLDIRLYIVSGGIQDSIEYSLERNNISTNNIVIISNKLKFDRENIVGIDGNIITSCNKDDICLPIGFDEHGLLFGDIKEDKKMGHNYDTYDIGFMENNASFDMTLTGDSSFSDVCKIMIKGYKK